MLTGKFESKYPVRRVIDVYGNETTENVVIQANESVVYKTVHNYEKEVRMADVNYISP